MDDWTGSVESFVVQDAAKTAEESPTRAKTLKETSRQFLTFSFCTIALSFSIIVFGMGTFILLSVDLAQDRGIAPYEAVYLLHAFTVGDIVFRALCGIVIDKGVLSLEAVMLTGYLVQAFAFELLVWSGTLPMMLLCSVLVGISNGSRISLQAPALINDFGVDTLPIMMGGMVFCIGFIALGRPLLIGFYRDKMGEYSGLLHILAVVNAVMFLVWSVRLLLKRRTAEPIKDDPILRNTNEPLLESHSVKVGEDS